MLNVSDYYIDNDLRIDRPDNRKGGGLIVYARKDIVIKPEKSTCNFNEYCMFQVMQKNNCAPLNVVLLYRPPNTESENDSELVKLIEQTKAKTFIFGDFNLPKTNFEDGTSDAKGLGILNAVENKFLEQIVDFKTHIHGNKLDLVFTNIPDSVISVSDCGNLANSDHTTIKVEMDISPEFNESSELIRDWRRGDQEGLINCVQEIDFVRIFQGKDANQRWETLREVIDCALDRYIPMTTRRKPGEPPWLTPAVKRITRRKKRFWKRFTRNRTDGNFANYKESEKQCKKAVQQAKKKFEKKLADNGNKRPFNAYIKSKTKTRQNVGPLKVNNKLVTENVEMAEALNEFFSSVFTKEDPGPLPHCPKLPSETTLNDMWIDSEMVRNKILKLKPGSAPGPDGIKAKFLIMNAAAMAPALAMIYNESLQSGVVPDDWKTANVTPIFKKGSNCTRQLQASLSHVYSM